VNVRAWKRENMAYGSNVMAIGLDDHQKKARRKYWTFSSSIALLTNAALG